MPGPGAGGPVEVAGAPGDAELRQRADGAAAQHGVDGGLAQVPVPRAEQPHRAVHRVDGPPRRLVQQRLEQGCDRASEVPSAARPGNGKHACMGGRRRRTSDGRERKRKRKRVRTRALRVRDGGDEGEEARAAEELGDEDGGVALRVGGVDPLEAGAQHAGLAAALAQHPAPVAAHTDTTTVVPAAPPPARSLGTTKKLIHSPVESVSPSS